jgi:predicted dehydrogenase
MNLLIVGMGSIGRRHARVFKAAGVERIAGVDLQQDRLDQARQELEMNELGTDYQAMLASNNYDAVVVSVPGAWHVPVALAAAKTGHHLFIEKPLSDKQHGLDELERVVTEQQLVAYIGYCYRFAPASERMKEIIDSGRLGRIFSARIKISTYLPDWHPWEDYRNSYAAKLVAGGGARLDDSHGVDLLRWLCGDVASVYAVVDKLSDLEIEADDFTSMILRFKNGAVGEIHLNLFGQPTRIDAEIMGNNGTLLWDRISGRVEVYDSVSKKWQVDDFGRDSFVTSYERQARHFLECVRDCKPSRTPIADGRKTLDVLIAALRSSQAERLVFVEARP